MEVGPKRELDQWQHRKWLGDERGLQQSEVGPRGQGQGLGRQEEGQCLKTSKTGPQGDCVWGAWNTPPGCLGQR